MQVVLAVAEAGSISRAAARLKIAQAGLTAQLRRIEDSFGGSLFVRRPDGVTLTDLGVHVVRRGRDLTEQFDDMVAIVRLLGRPERPVAMIRCGGTDATLVPLLATAVARLLPDAEQTTLQQQGIAESWELLRANELDMAVAAVCVAGTAQPPAELLSRTLTRDIAEIALPAGHPLGDLSAVRLSDLAEENWVAPDDRVDGLRLGLRLACERAGFTPRLRHFGADRPSAARLVADGHAIALSRLSDPSQPGIVRRPLAVGGIQIHTRMFWAAESPLAPVADSIRAMLIGEHTAVERRRCFVTSRSSHWPTVVSTGTRLDFDDGRPQP